MVEGVQYAAQLINQALTYLVNDNKIFGMWGSIIIVVCLVVYFVDKLANRKD